LSDFIDKVLLNSDVLLADLLDKVAVDDRRNGTVVPDSLVERMLCRDGIRREAYIYISHHHTLRASHI
jgi:hypothetical protein